MKIKLTWFLSIPFFIVIFLLCIMEPLFLKEQNTFLGFDKISAAYTAIVLMAVFAIGCKIFSWIDKETSGIFLEKRNLPAGITAVFLAIFALISGINSIFILLDGNIVEWSAFFDVIFSLLASFAFVIVAIFQISGKYFTSNFSILLLMPAIWGGVKMFFCFASYTTLSIAANDMTDLILYILFSAYFFCQAAVWARIPNKNAIKSTFVFGLPLICLSISYYFKKMILIYQNGVDENNISQYISLLLFFVASIYAIIMLVDYTRFVKTNKEIENIFGRDINKDDEENFDDTIKEQATSRVPIINTEEFEIFPSEKEFEDNLTSSKKKKAHKTRVKEDTQKENEEFHDISSEKKEEDIDITNPSLNSDEGEEDGYRLKEIDELINELS